MFHCNVFFSLSVFIVILLPNVQSLEYEEITSDQEATIGEFPYHVNIQIKSKFFGYEVRCGGAILDKTHVVTGALCITDLDGSLSHIKCMTVKGGTIDLKTTPKYRGIAEGIYLPTDFNHDISNVRADIAVLKLSKEIPLEDYRSLNPVELPDNDKNYEDAEAKFTGFGLNKVRQTVQQNLPYQVKGYTDNKLHFGNVVFMNESYCSRFRLHKNFKDNFCAEMKQVSRSPQGTCYEDDGGPLVVDELGRKNILVGILSKHTYLCDESNEPSWYTRVSTYLDFIEAAKNDEIGDKGSYTPIVTAHHAKCSVQR